MGVGGANSAYGEERVCEVTVDVTVPGRERYRASCKHPIPMIYLPQMQTPGAAVAVRVAGVDGDVAVPTHKSPVKAAEILARGTACKASLLMTMPLGQQNDEGLDILGLILSVTVADGSAYQAQIGMGVPAAAVPLLYPGAELPARALDEWLRAPSPPDMVTIDWDAALR